jgi:hypothetical protein
MGRNSGTRRDQPTTFLSFFDKSACVAAIFISFIDKPAIIAVRSGIP